MAAKDLEGLGKAVEQATPETVEAVSRFLRAAGSDEFHQVLAVRTLVWFARGVELLDRDRVMEALAAPAGYEAVLPLVEEIVLDEAGQSPVARARLRGIHRKRELIEAEGGSVGTSEAAQLLGGISKQAVDKRRERGTILALPAGGGGYAYPIWQFDELSGDGLIPGFARVLKSFSVKSPWMRAEFMLAPSARFDGGSPLDALVAGEAEEVTRAASAYGEQGAQ